MYKNDMMAVFNIVIEEIKNNSLYWTYPMKLAIYPGMEVMWSPVIMFGLF